jgi:methylthioribose-1-phosphate isomerase
MIGTEGTRLKRPGRGAALLNTLSRSMRTLEYDERQRALLLIDQTRLPHETVLVACRTPEEVAQAITSMRVRGAPAIGVAAAYGMALGAQAHTTVDPQTFVEDLERSANMLRSTRPTAVNLRWAIERMFARGRSVAEQSGVPAARAALLILADEMAEEDVVTNRRIGAFGLDLVPVGANVLTHCNAGALATVDYGTALGVVRAAHDAGREIHVYVDETRPFLQGARLTAWELQQLGVPMTLITDSMAGHFMNRGQVDLVVVGADRVAANGDVANKIGTYSLAVLARENGVPFYVAAPISTIDLSIKSGAEIPIEERSSREVTEIAGASIAPAGVHAAHPAFDVTPARLVSAIITERGILRAPYEQSLADAVHAAAPVAV